MSDEEHAIGPMETLVAQAISEATGVGYDIAVGALKEIAENTPCVHCHDALMLAVTLLKGMRPS